MHNWKNRTSYSISDLEKIFTDMTYETDHTDEGYDTCRGLRLLDREFKSEDEACQYLTSASYGDNRAACARVVTGKKTKTWENAWARYKTRRADYLKFDKDLSAAYGRTSEKVTCPHCGSSMTRKYLTRTKYCPVCSSHEIISKSNWEKLKLKERLMQEADDNLASVSKKCGIIWVASFEWHS